ERRGVPRGRDQSHPRRSRPHAGSAPHGGRGRLERPRRDQDRRNRALRCGSAGGARYAHKPSGDPGRDHPGKSGVEAGTPRGPSATSANNALKSVVTARTRALEPRITTKSRPSAVDAPSPHSATQDEQGRAVATIGALIPVPYDSATLTRSPISAR